jgi:predicted MPP superfamily phosphohydrolase
MCDPSSKVILVHLSDIHFVKASTVGPDVLDEDVRRELKRDVIALCGTLGSAHGILVTGDIAYSGKSEEYKRAEDWLLELCRETKCDEQNVWMICGNHDVQRDVIANSVALRDFQTKLRAQEPEKIDAVYHEYLTDAAARTIVFSALQNYNDFARKFGGHFAHDRIFWEKDIVLNDGSKLRIRGLNSAIGCNKDDHKDTGKATVGSANCAVPRLESHEYMVLCHHPPDWLRDSDEVARYLNSRVRLQLYGHKHIRRIEPGDENGFGYLKLHAGAVNPAQGETVKPRYNVIAIHVSTSAPEEKKRTLHVEIHPRIWDPDQTKFIPETAACTTGGTSKVLSLSLDWLEKGPQLELASTPQLAEVASQPQVNNPLNIPTPAEPAPKVMNGSWKLSFRFLSLPFHKRMEVANELHLLEDSDSQIDHAELFRRLFRRAAERNELREFYNAVEKKHTGTLPTDNPFT